MNVCPIVSDLSREAADDATIAAALAILRSRAALPRDYITQSNDIRRLLEIRLMQETDREVFTAVFLDARHGVIHVENMFYGSLTGATVYIGRVVRAALLHNAAALVIAHNHPSGVPDPSQADRVLTDRLRDALALVDIRLLDHVIVGAEASYSFSERGWL